MSLKENVKQLNQMVFQGQILEAFDRFYHPNVVMQENLEAERVGKEANRAYEEQFVGALEAVHGGGIDHVLVDEDQQVAMIESWMDVSFKDGNRVKMAQVAVQQWKEGQVIHERFYHA